jgi:glycyl-tRNA synthetase alpha chain
MNKENITFSQILLKLQQFLAVQGCNIVQSYDISASIPNFTWNNKIKITLS